jgi:DNA repair protein RadC
MSNSRPSVTDAIVIPEEDLSGKTATTHGCGHRSRLLERFTNNGIGALHPHEIIELLLTFTIPRRDTKPIAHALLKRFKTISAVCNAPTDELLQIDGIGKKSAALLQFVRDVLAYCLKERFERGDYITSRQDVEAYLKFMFGYRRDEYVAALFLDAAHHIVQTELVAEGTVNQCALYPRIFIEKALRYGAASMIVAHNHPGGTPLPSENDWQITERLYTAGKLLDLPLLDHILICSEKTVSLVEFPRWPGKRGNNHAA